MSERCRHLGLVELRVRRSWGGNMVAQGQCQQCFRGVGPKAKVIQPGPLRWWRRTPSAGKRARSYRKQLASHRWKLLRLEVLARDGWICRSCGAEATEVHHLPSAVYGAEDLEDLIAVCRDCNQGERSARIARGVLGS